MVKIIFIHPDLGIGGAERLVIDAALALKKKGHETSFITAHHDPNHCFPETVDGQLDVMCLGDWLPRSTFGYMCAFWAYIRMIYISLYIALTSNNDYDVAFVDQISACIPFLKLKKKLKIIFYCHYPDQLLTERKNLLKILYRKVIDKIEESTTNMADTILVNSKFTSKVFKDTFKSINTTPNILYPSIDFSKFDKPISPLPTDLFMTKNRITFLSLNRFERKKNVALAIKALKIVIDNNMEDDNKGSVHLVIAGGYDNRVLENKEYFFELVKLSEDLDLGKHITFMKSPSDEVKQALFKEACCLLYTPDKEHFGIVPIESMYMGTPVIAVNSGGPVETVINGKTGYLRDQTAESFAEAMKYFIEETTGNAMSKNCRSHVLNKFSFDKFTNQLDYVVQSLVDGRKQN